MVLGIPKTYVRTSPGQVEVLLLGWSYFETVVQCLAELSTCTFTCVLKLLNVAGCSYYDLVNNHAVSHAAIVICVAIDYICDIYEGMHKVTIDASTYGEQLLWL